MSGLRFEISLIIRNQIRRCRALRSFPSRHHRHARRILTRHGFLNLWRTSRSPNTPFIEVKPLTALLNAKCGRLISVGIVSESPERYESKGYLGVTHHRTVRCASHCTYQGV